jgi:hypothetical protein
MFLTKLENYPAAQTNSSQYIHTSIFDMKMTPCSGKHPDTFFFAEIVKTKDQTPLM